MTEYERGFTDGIKSKVSAELTPTLINVSKTMLEMLKPVLSTALENALNDNNAITDTDIQPVNQWISVDDRLPEEIGYYLVVIGNEMLISIDIAEYSEGYWHKHDKVLYWQPLPDYPE